MKFLAVIALICLAGCAYTPSQMYVFDGKRPLIVHMLNEQDWWETCDLYDLDGSTREGFQWNSHIYLREKYCGQDTTWHEMRHVVEGAYHK